MIDTPSGTTTDHTEHKGQEHSNKSEPLPSQNSQPSLGKQTYVYFMTYVVHVAM